MSRLIDPSLRGLYTLASLLWIIAGANILRIGLDAWRSTGLSLWVILWLVASLGFFSGLIFPRVVKKNLAFIHHIPAEKLRWWHCFSPSSWLIMAVMIALGMTLRLFHLVSESFIAGFYTGLGASLIQATLPYLQHLYKPKG